MASKKRAAAEVQSVLPEITAEQVRAYRLGGQLGRVEVYPIPDLRAADAPASVVRELPRGLSQLEYPPAKAAGPAHFQFVVAGRAPIRIERSGVIGRNPDESPLSQSVALDDPGRSLSRNHLGFELESRGRLLVYDLNSANGSQLITAGDVRIDCLPGKRYPVEPGDTIILGSYTVAVTREH